jgi:formate dehydrogenase accessory protein FdhE
MTQAKVQSQWERRIRRANELTSVYPFAAEGLRFYARVAELQRGLYDEAARVLAGAMKTEEALPLREELASPALLPRFAQFAAMIGSIAPEPLANAGALLAHVSPEERHLTIEGFLRAGSAAVCSGEDEDPLATGRSTLQERLLAWLFLQPFAEFLAERRASASTAAAPLACPMCGSNPIVGVLRPEGDGGKKSLVCMLCAHEWAFRRIYCPACGEEREPQMGLYSAPEMAHVRVDVCDTCHTYLKTVDLTKSGLAVPLVDELASIPLDLWACEHGYRKLQINLIGA